MERKEAGYTRDVRNMSSKVKAYKGSKKSKKSWRKHSDIADVEEYLEEVRRDERTGGSVSNKPDEALFFVERESSSSGKKIVSEKKKKTAGIEADDDDEAYIPRMKKLSDKLEKETKLLEKEIVEARNAKVQTIWGQDVMTVTDAYLESTVKKPKVMPSTCGVGKSDVDAVILPDPGTSYNPDYDSHQRLLLKAHKEELMKATQEKKLMKKVKMVSVKELKKQSKLWLKEMSEGLSQNANEPDDQDGQESCVTRVVVSSEKRKTSQQRRKQLLMKKMNQLKLEQKKKKARLNDIMRIKSIKREIGSHAGASDRKIEERQRKSASERRPKRLSRYKFVESHTAVQLSEELSGSLHGLKTEGGLIKDRFKSLQRRNIIETRNRVLPRSRYKRKNVVKRSYKTRP